MKLRPSRFDPGSQQRCLPTPHRPVSSWTSTAVSLTCHTGALRLWEVLCDHHMDLKCHGCGYTFAPCVKHVSYVLLARSLDFEMNTCINGPCVKRKPQENAHENTTHPLCKALGSRVRGWGLTLVTSEKWSGPFSCQSASVECHVRLDMCPQKDRQRS